MWQQRLTHQKYRKPIQLPPLLRFSFSPSLSLCWQSDAPVEAKQNEDIGDKQLKHNSTWDWTETILLRTMLGKVGTDKSKKEEEHKIIVIKLNVVYIKASHHIHMHICICIFTNEVEPTNIFVQMYKHMGVSSKQKCVLKTKMPT